MVALRGQGNADDAETQYTVTGHTPIADDIRHALNALNEVGYTGLTDEEKRIVDDFWGDV